MLWRENDLLSVCRKRIFTMKFQSVCDTRTILLYNIILGVLPERSYHAVWQSDIFILVFAGGAAGV